MQLNAPRLGSCQHGTRSPRGSSGCSATGPYCRSTAGICCPRLALFAGGRVCCRRGSRARAAAAWHHGRVDRSDEYPAANRPCGQHRFGFGMSGRLLCNQRFVGLLPWWWRPSLAVRCRDDCRCADLRRRHDLVVGHRSWLAPRWRARDTAMDRPGVIAWVMTTVVDDDVDLPESEKRVIEPIARYGLAGSGVGAALVGIYWMSAGIHGEASRAHELGGALQTVQQNSRGWLLLLPLGIAFAASALFDFIEALYHRPDRP